MSFHHFQVFGAFEYGIDQVHRFTGAGRGAKRGGAVKYHAYPALGVRARQGQLHINTDRGDTGIGGFLARPQMFHGGEFG